MIDTSGPAFPRPASEDTRNGSLKDGDLAIADQSGMSLRDWFAGQALVGTIAAHADTRSDLPGYGDAARIAYAYADAMIRQRTEADGGQS